MPNSHAVPVLLDNEVSALKSRLAEATIALDRIEAAVVAIDKDAPAEVHALAATILRQVLSSADHVRPKESGFVHAWEREAYADYEAGARHTAGAYNSARVLIARTQSLCGQQRHPIDPRVGNVRNHEPGLCEAYTFVISEVFVRAKSKDETTLGG